MGVHIQSTPRGGFSHRNAASSGCCLHCVWSHSKIARHEKGCRVRAAPSKAVTSRWASGSPRGVQCPIWNCRRASTDLLTGNTRPCLQTFSNLVLLPSKLNIKHEMARG
eukprot:scaffold153556_cov43-Prasinocladus_malaysianus.AAC.2